MKCKQVRCKEECEDCETGWYKASPASDGYGALVLKLDEYIEFLNTANQGPITLAFSHGWRCPADVLENSSQLRAEIEELREAL